MSHTQHVVKDHVLANGIRVIHVRTALPVTTIALWLATGSRRDPQGKEGIAHLMEHLLMKTTSELPTVSAVRADLAARGIAYNATTFAEKMQFCYSVLSEDAVRSMAHFVDVFMTMQVDEGRLVGEKKIVADERNRKRQAPARLAWENARAAMFPGTGIDHSGLGTAESVEGITHRDVMDFAKEHVIDAPKTFVICSPFEPEVFYADLMRLPESAAPALSATGAATTIAPLPVAIEKADGPNVQVVLGFGVYGCDTLRQEAALELLTHGYLFAGQSSRLYQRLREENHLTYSVAGDLVTYTDRAHAQLHFSVAKERVNEALAICDEEINRVRSGEIDEQALAAAKKGKRYELLSLAMQPSRISGWYAADAMLGRPVETIDERCALYASLTSDDLVNAAKKHFVKERKSVALYGDVEVVA